MRKQKGDERNQKFVGSSTLERQDEEGQPLIADIGRPSYDTTSSSLRYDNDSTRSTVPPPPPPPPFSKNQQTVFMSSLDFERVVNSYSIQATKIRLGLWEEEEDDAIVAPSDAATKSTRTTTRTNKKARTALHGRHWMRWIFSSVVGLLTGILTIGIVSVTTRILDWRIAALDQMAQTEEIPNGIVFLGYACLNMILAVSASMLCVYIVPQGSGSGIPQVQAYLNGVRVRKFASWKLLVVKVLGTILSVSSSLAVGMEGPLVHIGAIVGASFSKLSTLIAHALAKYAHLLPDSLTTWIWKVTTTYLAPFSNDAERRDMMSIGASVGFAASFGAPIGGLLFILADVSSSFSKPMFLRTLVANAIGTLCLAIQAGNLSNYSVIDLGTFVGSSNENVFLDRFELIPLFVLVGIGGGILGGVFCASFRFLQVRVMAQFQTPRAHLLYVAVVSLITSTTFFLLPIMAWTCKVIDDDVTEGTTPGEIQMHMQKENGRQFFCDTGQVNEMATIVFGSRGFAIKRMLADPRVFQPRTLWIVGFSFYVLMILTCVSRFPSGTFTPTVLVGASLGGAMGMLFQDVLGPSHNIPPSTFALAGVAAMLAGIQRSTVSIAVILVEGTGQIKVLLPTILVVVVSRYVAGLIHPEGLFETAMSIHGYFYMDHDVKRDYDILEASEIMSAPPKVIGPMMRARDLVSLLQENRHNGFPVVNPKTQQFLGLVRRDQIVALLECGVFEDEAMSLIELSSNNDSSGRSRSTSGVSSPLMHWAYHIQDDRYDYLKNNIGTTTYAPPAMDKEIRGSVLKVPIGGDETMPTMDQVVERHESIRPVPPRQAAMIQNNYGYQRTSSSSSASVATPQGFAKVGVDTSMGYYLLVVTWLNPEYRNMYVNISLVMNRGAYCVRDDTPVSKVRLMFTQLGLRHLTVVGDGGKVVGILTRANLRPSYIQERTGLQLE